MATSSVVHFTPFRNYRRLFLVLLTGLLAYGVVVAATPAAARSRTTAKVTTLQHPDTTPIPPDEREVVGKATLWRSPQGIRAQVKTTKLEPGAAYTAWWVIFNYPGRCDHGCGADDLSNPDVEASILYATGRVADADGKAQFRSFLPVGLVRLNRTVEGRERHRLGPGLQRVWTSEVHYIIRSHGLASASTLTLVEQLSTFGGSCDKTICFNPQAVVFPLRRR